MENNYLPMEKLEPGRIYWLNSRNLVVGAWNPDTKGFIGVRYKFGHAYLFTEYHYDASATMGTARPLEAAGERQVPEDVLLNELLPGSWCGDDNNVEVRFLKEERRWEHIADGTTCSEPTAMSNKALFDILEPLDIERHKELNERF